jgi:hypothetical protein
MYVHTVTRMRQSLSQTTSASAYRLTLLAVALSVLLAAITLIDQRGGKSLLDHASSAYAQHGKEVSGAALYGLLYGVAVLDALLWLLVTGLTRSHRVLAAGVGVLAVLLTAGLGVTLLVASEYGVHPFTPLWGVLALLPAASGAVAVVLLVRRCG